MNPGGVRIGSCDFYHALEEAEDVADSVVVGQKWRDDERILLFVVLRDGSRDISKDKEQALKRLLRSKLSPRHVPAKIIAVDEVPYTFNGKKAEISVKRAVDGMDVSNLSALRNPESIATLKRLRKEWES